MRITKYPTKTEIKLDECEENKKNIIHKGTMDSKNLGENNKISNKNRNKIRTNVKKIKKILFIKVQWTLTI